MTHRHEGDDADGRRLRWEDDEAVAREQPLEQVIARNQVNVVEPRWRHYPVDVVSDTALAYRDQRENNEGPRDDRTVP